MGGAIDGGASGAFLDLPPDLSDPRKAAIAVLPVAYDATSSWHKGADKGPAAMIEASANLEWWDIETASEVCRRGIVTLAEVRCDGPPEEMSEIVRARVAAMLGRGWFPVVLGGEHSVSIGAIDAMADAHGDLVVLQVDAHADTRESYEGSTHNHACVMARARERCEIVQVGIRSICAEEALGLDPERVFYAHDIVRCAR